MGVFNRLLLFFLGLVPLFLAKKAQGAAVNVAEPLVTEGTRHTSLGLDDFPPTEYPSGRPDPDGFRQEHTVEQPHELQPPSPPTMTFRFVDEKGNVTEVPIQFKEAQLEPRGFWGDVLANGMALFLAYAAIIILKELLTWSSSRRKKAAESSLRAHVALRREAISAELRTIESGFEDIERSDKGGRDEGAEEELKHFLDLLDGYRYELKDYDTPALVAYIDSLIVKISQLLKHISRNIPERERLDGPSASPVPSTNISESESVGAEGSASQAGNHDAETKEQVADGSDKVSGENEGERSEKEITASQTKQKPDMDLVLLVKEQNPDLSPRETILLASELTRKRRNKRDT
ncbi:hypothetical protein cyc_06667 [Cyclospora cayetanensis]|nr:hypothetical protein cyc_06667 [Cyclospora cayetanensis]